MSLRLAWTSALLALLLLARPARAGDRACSGQLSGAVSGKFSCAVEVKKDDGSGVFIVIQATSQIPDVPAFAPGGFHLAGPLEKGAYSLSDMVAARASVAVEGGALYTATKTTGQRGEAKLTIESVGVDPKGSGRPTVTGSYRARLVPTSGDRSGEVTIEVLF